MTFLDATFDEDLVGSTSPRLESDERADPWRILGARLDAVPRDVTTSPDQEVGERLDWDDALTRCTERSSVVALIRLSGFDEISDRVSYLLQLEEHLEENEEPIDLAALKGFADFMRKERRLEPPSEISVDPDGHIIAEWHYGSNRHLAIEFLDEQMTRFASIAPTRLTAALTRGLNGTAPLAEVVDSLAPIRVTRWRHG